MVNVTCDMCWATIKDFNSSNCGVVNISFNKFLNFPPVELHVCKACIRAKKRFWFEMTNTLYVEEEKKDEQGN